MKTEADTKNVSAEKAARYNVTENSSNMSSSSMSSSMSSNMSSNISSNMSSNMSSSVSSSTSSAYSLSSAQMLSKKRQAVFFDFDSTELDNQAQSTLNQLPNIEDYEASSVTITLTGHADEIGPEAYNKTLSRRRAEAVRDSIRSELPDTVSIDIVAQGESEPMSSNESEYGRSKNRRVEITYSAE